MKFLLQPAYWLGSLALALPLITITLCIPFINYIAIFVIFGISQISYLTAIKLLFKDHEEEIRKLKKQLKGCQ